jgi:hypothetical protein
MSNKKTIVIFQTILEGKLAQCEIEADPTALHSREARFDAENLARLAFSRLSPFWNAGQKIKAVDIVTEYVAETDPESIPTADWSDVAFTCDYCSNKWRERYPAAGIVHKTLRGCRRCLVKLKGPGVQVRYTGGREIRGDDRQLSDRALQRGSVYVVVEAYKSPTKQGIRVRLSGIPGLFDFLLFEPAEFAVTDFEK